MNYMNVQFDECLKTFKDAKEKFNYLDVQKNKMCLIGIVQLE